MADSFDENGLSDDEATKNSAQVISEPTGKPQRRTEGAKRHSVVFRE